MNTFPFGVKNVMFMDTCFEIILSTNHPSQTFQALRKAKMILCRFNVNGDKIQLDQVITLGKLASNYSFENLHPDPDGPHVEERVIPMEEAPIG